MSNLKNYNGRPLKSAEDSNIDLSSEETEEQKKKRDEEKKDDTEGKSDDKPKAGGIPESELDGFCTWLKETLGESRVSDIKVTNRLSDSPAIVTDHESGSMRRMMKIVVSMLFSYSV